MLTNSYLTPSLGIESARQAYTLYFIHVHVQVWIIHTIPVYKHRASTCQSHSETAHFIVLVILKVLSQRQNFLGNMLLISAQTKFLSQRISCATFAAN